LFAAPALNRVIPAKDDRAFHWQQGQKQTKQNLHCLKRIPPGPIENPMVVLEVSLIAETHHSQTTRYGTFSARQQGSKQEHFCVLPSRVGERRLETYNQVQQIGRECLHTEDSLCLVFFRSLRGLPYLFQRSKLDKVESDEAHWRVSKCAAMQRHNRNRVRQSVAASFWRQSRRRPRR